VPPKAGAGFAFVPTACSPGLLRANEVPRDGTPFECLAPTDFKRLLLGSTTERVAEAAPCLVLVARRSNEDQGAGAEGAGL